MPAPTGPPGAVPQALTAAPMRSRAPVHLPPAPIPEAHPTEAAPHSAAGRMAAAPVAPPLNAPTSAPDPGSRPWSHGDPMAVADDDDLVERLADVIEAALLDAGIDLS